MVVHSSKCHREQQDEEGKRLHVDDNPGVRSLTLCVCNPDLLSSLSRLGLADTIIKDIHDAAILLCVVHEAMGMIKLFRQNAMQENVCPKRRERFADTKQPFFKEGGEFLLCNNVCSFLAYFTAAGSQCRRGTTFTLTSGIYMSESK
jgi:hypothetical protein